MFKWLFNKKSVVVKYKSLSNEKLEEIKRNNLVPFTDYELLLVKDDVVVGRIKTIEKVKPGSMTKGTFGYVRVYIAEAENFHKEFMNKDLAIRSLVEHTLPEALD